MGERLDMAGGPESKFSLPRVIVSGERVHIDFVNQGVSVDVSIDAKKGVQATPVNLSPRDLAAIEAENQFSQVVRQDIGSYLQWQASKLMPGSEEVAAEMELMRNRELFKQGVTTLRSLKYNPTQVKDLVTGQGRLIEVGATYMGEKIPRIVSEEVGTLNKYVDVFYKREERREQKEAQNAAKLPARPRSLTKPPLPGQAPLL